VRLEDAREPFVQSDEADLPFVRNATPMPWLNRNSSTVWLSASISGDITVPLERRAKLEAGLEFGPAVYEAALEAGYSD
jgi:hypothetical protein